MLAKCLWKLYCYRQGSHVDYTEVLDALTRAIECIPQKRDNRHPDKDLPILEPHYKLVSIVHKLVQRQKITVQALSYLGSKHANRYFQTREGCQFLDATPYAQKIPHIQEQEDWEGYIISILKSLRAADKANWHHRMVARVCWRLTLRLPPTNRLPRLLMLSMMTRALTTWLPLVRSTS